MMVGSVVLSTKLVADLVPNSRNAKGQPKFQTLAQIIDLLGERN